MKNLLLVAILFISFSTYSQKKVHIKSVRITYKVNYNLDPKKYFEAETRIYESERTRESVLGSLSKTKAVISVLEIDNHVSIYKVNENDINEDKDGTPGINFSVALAGSDNIYYQNNLTKEYFYKGKNMAMLKELVYFEEPKFKLLEGQETILGYVCNKAELISTSKNKTYVWYTKDLPFTNGPLMHFGLEGVILKTQRNMGYVLAEKIELNPKDISIVKPEADLKTTYQQKKKAFQKIMTEN